MQVQPPYRFVLLGLALLLAACGSPAEPPTPTAPRPARLTPFATFTAGAAPTPLEAAPATPPPPPSPTPRTHTVQAGEDMLGIALRYGVSLSDLMAANPEVNPRFLSIGTVLIIPPAAGEPTLPPAAAPQVEVALGRLVCWRVESGGAWCFLPVQNNQEFAVESLSARIRVYGPDGQEAASQLAAAPLDLLPPGALLPLAAYFAPPLPEPLQASAELMTALPLTAENNRYLPARFNNQQTAVAADGLSVQVSGEVTLEAGEGQASRLWVAVVAYDAADQIVGVRRWESSAPLAAGEALPVAITVYSVGGKIARAETLVEARP